jgi:CheY-like chemotaxis protein
MTHRLVVVATENHALRSLPGQLGDSVSVTIYDSANDALWEVRANPPQAVIAEVDLPGMTGLELAEILPNFEVPTKILLWGTDEAARAQAESLGVFRYLAGELAPAAIQAALQSAFAAAAADAEAAALAEPEPEPEPEPAPPQPAPRSGPRLAPRPPPAPRPLPRQATTPPPEPQPDARPRDFTPARVTLPTMAEREAASAPPAAPAAPAAPRGGLAARSKAAVERKPEPRPAPAEEPMPFTNARRSSGNMVVTTENISPIKSIMSQLEKELGAQSVMLTDRAGMVLVEVGTTQNLPMMIVLPLLSTGFSTTGEVARQLREEDATSVYIHEGLNVDLYCFDVSQRFLLVLVFNKKVASSKIGSVWINAKRAIRELREALDR